MRLALAQLEYIIPLLMIDARGILNFKIEIFQCTTVSFKV